MKELLFLKPVFKETIWGGRRLKIIFGYDIPNDHTGECWAVSANKNGDCVIISGRYEGRTLSELWEKEHSLFGNAKGERFPLLTKIIDAEEDLSIQVHPDDTYAREYENGSSGKTESWYILDCAPDAAIVIGHHARTKEELFNMIENKRWKELIREIPIKKGDFLQINPGTVYAIKGGTLLLETQQNSDITYRLYDYDRLSNGVLRELHLQKGMDVITCPHKDSILNPSKISSVQKRLVSCPYYTVDLLDIKNTISLEQDQDFKIFSVIDGEGAIDGVRIRKGDHFILPYDYGRYCLNGNMKIICSYANTQTFS